LTEGWIDRDRIEVSQSKINSCIYEAIENSNAKYLKKEILNCVSFDFVKYQDKGYKKGGEGMLSVLFCFSFKQSGPMSYIFNTGLMQKLR
jgi:hypothetical protein